jgi:hypothetical protein
LTVTLAPLILESKEMGTATVESVYCPTCGHLNPNGVNFCSSCGAALVTSAPDTSVSVHPIEESGDGIDDDAGVGLLELPRGVALLVIRKGIDRGARFALEAGVTRVGRDPDSEIFLDDITVSRRHAELVTNDKVTTVRDVGSLNGTYVNRERIEETALASGDELQIGKFKLLFLVASGE